MSRSAAGVDYRPFQVFQKLVLSRSRELYYIGGSDVLPAPLEPKREAYVISKLKTEQEQEARSLLSIISDSSFILQENSITQELEWKT